MTSTGDMLDIAEDARATAPVDGSRWQRLDLRLRSDQAKLQYTRIYGEPDSIQVPEEATSEEKALFWDGVEQALNHVLNLMARMEQEDRQPFKLED